MSHEAIYSLYPNVVRIDDSDGAFDKDDNLVEIDETAVKVKAEELQAARIAEQKAQAAAKDSALAKLKKLGLTDDEISALKGTL